MNKVFIKRFLPMLFILLIPLSGVFAAQDDGVYTYTFHLYFDNGKLVKDRDFENSFELIAQEYNDVKIEDGAYFGEILSISNKKLAEFPFYLPAGNKGKLSPIAPYFDNAKTANFYNPQNQKLFIIDLAPSGPVCNEDKQCNGDTGETSLNCPSDCSIPDFRFSGPIYGWKDFLSEPISFIILAVIIIGTVVWFWLRRRKNNSFQNPETPPQI